ncbi:MAG: OmpA family protein [Bacteroidia bacterium]|nr:OmpA family protein [Bacteroidia bacterium]
MSLLKVFVRFFCLAVVLSQTSCLSVHLRTANEYYQQFAYSSAAHEYEHVLSKKADREAMINVADCYRQLGNPVKTEYWYRKTVKLSNPKIEWNLYLADALMKNGNYTEAKENLVKYLELNKADYKAQRMLGACDSIGLFYRDTTLYTVAPLKFNTPRENYFSPAFYKQGIVFLSDRSEKGLSKAVSDGTGRRFLDLFYAKKTDRGNWMEPEPLRGEVNGKFNEGPAVFANGYSTMYFTRNNYVSNRSEKNSRNVNVLKIFRADAEEGEWKVKGPMYFNSDEYSVGHPALNPAGTVIVFSSDMPWGYGGADLYMVRWEGGDRWSSPVNLGPSVNTEGNELFPFLMNDSMLYFASDGHAGMGGLDIFESQWNGIAWSAPYNPGYPLNSSHDDFSYIVDSAGMQGYFSSSRNGLFDKLYSFEKHPPQLFLFMKVTDAVSRLPVAGAQVKLSAPGLAEKTYAADAGGTIRITVQPGKDFKVSCDHPDYFLVHSEASTMGMKFSDTVEVDIEMRKVQLNKAFTWQGIAFKKKDFQLKLSSGEAMQRLNTLLRDNPRLQIEIASYTDSRNSDADNMKLTQQRADLVQSFLVSQGIAASRLTAKGYGENKLLNRCVNGILCIEEDHEVNNRIEITIRGILKEDHMP